MGPITGLDVLEKGKISDPYQDSNPGLFSPLTSRYADRNKTHPLRQPAVNYFKIMHVSFFCWIESLLRHRLSCLWFLFVSCSSFTQIPVCYTKLNENRRLSRPYLFSIHYHCQLLTASNKYN